MKITIIGAGNMGGALAKGWAKVATNNNIVITMTARSQSTLDKIKVASPFVGWDA